MVSRISRRVGWALASPSGCNPPASGFAGSTPARRTRLNQADRDMARSSIGSGHRPLKAVRRVRFPPGLLTGSSRPIRSAQAWRAPAGSHKAGLPDRDRGLGFAGGPVHRPSLMKPGRCGSTPIPAMLQILMPRSWQSSRGPAATTPRLTKRKRGFDSLRDDSAAVESGGGSRSLGGSSNGKTPGLQPGNRGSTPRRSTCVARSNRKAAGYGSPGLPAKECAPRGMRVQIPRLPLGFSSLGVRGER